MIKLTGILIMLFTGIMVLGQSKTIYLNSKTITCNPKGIKKACLQYKNAMADTVWSTYPGTIQGFTYNPGYFYALQVQPIKSNAALWKLVKVISKTASTVQQQPGDTQAIVSHPPVALVGEWHFAKLADAGGDITLTKEFLRFDAVEMKVTGRAACNSFFGNYTIEKTDGKSEIHFEALGHTMMACPHLPTENKLMHALQMINSWRIEGNKLYLQDQNRVLIELTRVEIGKA